MASSRTRQRKLERDRYERKLVRQAQQHRRKRQVTAGLGAFLTLAVLAVGSVWLAGGFEPDEPDPLAQPDLCTWLPRDPGDPNRVETGTPPANPPTGGQRLLTLDLDAGDLTGGEVEVAMDVAEDPCGAASLAHLAEQGFYDDTPCHEIADGALRCGDPSGTGLGGPSYAFWADNLPAPPPDPQASGSPDSSDQDSTDQEPLYPAGTVAFGDSAGENGSQFLIFFEDFDPDAPIFPVIGTVTAGLDVVEEIGEAGVAEGTTEPAVEVQLRSFAVSDAGTAPVR